MCLGHIYGTFEHFSLEKINNTNNKEIFTLDLNIYASLVNKLVLLKDYLKKNLYKILNPPKKS